MRSRLNAIALVLAVWLLLALVWPLDAIHPDSTHDLLMGRDCLELQRCDTAGPMSSWREIHQGALWLDLLALARSFWSPWGTGLFLALLNAIGIVATARWLQVRVPTARAILPLLLLTAVLATPVVLVMPTAMWPLSLVATCLFLQLLDALGLPGLLLLGVLLGCTADLHMMAWPLVWAVACLLWHRALRLGAGLVLLAALATSLGLSPRAWELLAIALQEQPAHLGVLLGLPVVWLLLRRVRQWPAERQLAAVGLLVWLVGGLTHQFSARYLFPWSGALWLAYASLLSQRRVWIRLLWLALVLLGVLRVQWGGVALSYCAVQDVAVVAQANRLGWPDVLTGLRGAVGPLLAESAALYLPLQRLANPQVVQLDVHDGFVTGAHPTTSRLQLAQTQVCQSSSCALLLDNPGPQYTPMPFVGRAIPVTLVVPKPSATLELRIPVRAGTPTTVTLAASQGFRHFLLHAPFGLAETLQRDSVDDACDWRFADGAKQIQLTAAAQTVQLTCATRRFPGAPPPRLLPGLQEACAQDNSCHPQGPLPPLRTPTLPTPLPEPLRFNRTASEALFAAILALAVWLGALARLFRQKPPVV